MHIMLCNRCTLQPGAQEQAALWSRLPRVGSVSISSCLLPLVDVCSLILEGFKSLAAGNPNMNSLVAVGCTTSFMVREP